MAPSDPAVKTGPTAVTLPEATTDTTDTTRPTDPPTSDPTPVSERADAAPQDAPARRRVHAGAPDAPDDAHELVRLLDEDGERHPSAEHDPWIEDLTDDDLLRLYEDMVVVRRLDAEATALQRQGELALWPPLLGQEAAQIGSAHALRPDDFVFSSYREHAVAHVRGVSPVDLVRVWRGITVSGWDPYSVNMATPQVIIGAQALHATGYALGVQNDHLLGEATADGDAPVDGDEPAEGDAPDLSVAVTYFGDGAMSQGDVNEAFVFAATYRAPVVFFCQNNQWAISEPVALQSPVALVERSGGFGIPGVRVDGNDILAVLAVTRAALQRARSDGGPTFVEAVTYRMGPHTTADDPTRYRDRAEVESWSRRDPVDRFAAYLRGRGVLDDAAEQRVRAAADAAAAELRAGCVALTDPPALSLFDHVYAEPNATIDRERAEYASYLAGFADDTADDDTADGGTHDEEVTR